MTEIGAVRQITVRPNDVATIVGCPRFEIEVARNDFWLEKILVLVDVADTVARATVEMQRDVRRVFRGPDVQLAGAETRLQVTAVGSTYLQRAFQAIVLGVQ